jgi:fermentation-respiration switch protein FrsA (DUF1100 family)
MKSATLILLLILITISSKAQDIIGQWKGILKVQGMELKILFNIAKNDTGYTSTMDSPDQGVKDIPVTVTNFNNSLLTLEIKNAGIKYTGELNKENIITGNFNQAGQIFPMNLTRQETISETNTRPQEPTKPYPYYAEDVSFTNNTNNITLEGTLTLPNKEGNFPAVVLISGSGPQNRDEEILGHKPFLVLADHLTKNGIAVLRFDDRGTGKSLGVFKTATTADFALDVEAAVQYLQSRKEINTKKIGLIGHSEGGIIAPMVAARSGKVGYVLNVSFIVLLAGTGIPGDQLLLLQQQLIGKASGMSEADLSESKKQNKAAFDIVVKATDTAGLNKNLTAYIKQVYNTLPVAKRPSNEAAFVSQQIGQLTNPWIQFFLKYNPAPTLQHVQCPVLALNGSNDLQVPASVNLAAIKKALEKGGNKNITVKELPALNHLFQESTTGSPSEYGKIEQTISPVALNEISKWIKEQVK